MKKNIFAGMILLAVFLLGTTGAMAGKPFEGIITFKISYPDSKFSESQLAMFPKVFTVSVKGDKSRTDLQMSGMNTVEITDYKTKSSVRLINMMGQKYAIKKSNDEIMKDMAEEGSATVEVTAETKTIAGYKCTKAIVTVNQDGVKSTFEGWFTKEIGSALSNFNNAYYKDIDGTLLEFTMKNREITMKFTATSVEKKSIADKDFEIPSDYTVTTEDELKSKFGGGND